MKRSTLLQIAKHLSRHRKIDAIERVGDTIIKIVFDRGHRYYFDMKRGDAVIFMTERYQKARHYQAPFDIVLSRRFHNAKIEKIEVPEGNRILRIHTISGSRYKAQRTILQLEFTGRNTNAIILDEDEIILEALRHIDAGTSYREIQPGVKLLPLEPRNFKESEPLKIENIESYLHDLYRKRESQRLEQLKLRKIAVVEKKLKKLQEILDGLESEERLLRKSEKYQLEAGLLLSHLHTMQNYQKEVKVTDYENKVLTIVLPSEARTPAEAANLLFRRAKKLKQKAKHTYIERENLEAKITFLARLKKMIEAAKSVDEAELYLPKQPKQQKKRAKEESNIETFFCEGYKISLGKNEKGNIALLKSARKSDIWMHLKDLPSTHVIIRSDKQKVPESVIAFGAKLCVGFSNVAEGSYLVDYTQRRNVKMKHGANVEYVAYQTVTAEKP
ncbi:MAG: hypothetical protein B6D59_04235 [Campylobacteraceae bacterium 4484_4]|nr:MAG: hypothetical protein B6D59_04235 [Campylobacteraceae bacterium 4484_4]